MQHATRSLTPPPRDRDAATSTEGTAANGQPAVIEAENVTTSDIAGCPKPDSTTTAVGVATAVASVGMTVGLAVGSAACSAIGGLLWAGVSALQPSAEEEKKTKNQEKADDEEDDWPCEVLEAPTEDEMLEQDDPFQKFVRDRQMGTEWNPQVI